MWLFPKPSVVTKAPSTSNASTIIDFASHIEQIGMRGIPVVGMSFCAVQGALVVGNKYMTHMVDNNKSEAGFPVTLDINSMLVSLTFGFHFFSGALTASPPI